MAIRERHGLTHYECVKGDVEVRAFRGTRRSAVYRSHVVGAEAAARIAAVARREGLETLAYLGGEPRELDDLQARRLAKEASRLRVEASLLELDADLTAIAAVARWCARAAEASWLTLSDAG